MSWITGLIGGVAAGAGVRGANQQVGRNNAFWQPGTINQYAQQFNPWVWNAIQGRRGEGGFQGDLYKMAQGQDISPWLLNNPLAQANQSANTNMARMQAQLGRSNMSGGLANAYTLSNAMGRQRNVSDLFQNYGQWREQQRRSDLNWLLGQVGQSQQQGWDMAGKKQFKKNFWEKLGAFGQGFMGGMGGGAMGGGGSRKEGKYPDTPWGPVMAGNPQYPTAAANRYGDWTGNTSNWGQGSTWGAGPSPMWGQ